ncbi:MAG: maltose alpha-D-glucosyltransferase [Chthoniobacterales bacterium]
MAKKSSVALSNPLWFKDAVIYETHIKAFFDSDGDGIGDFRGLMQKLDYLQNLGVTAIWVLPFYPSPLKDDGYDIADYFNVNPSYGTLKDFKDLLKEAKRRGIRVITELVLNHTSDQNAWFQESRRAPKGSAAREWYVWSDTPEKYQDARIIFKDFETSNWSWDPVAKAYYWHRFYSHQPDLNFENPKVHGMLLKVIDFWLAMGVDGLRLDAVPYLYEEEGTNCENLPKTHAFLKKLRAHIDSKFEDKMLLAEANQWPEDAAEYFGDGDSCHMNFHFPLMPRMFMGLQMEDRFPIMDILDQTPEIPEGCQWAIFLRNHDELTLEMVTDEERDYMYRVYAQDPRARINLGIRRRLAPLLLNNRRKIELINVLLFSLPGTPIIYYGDEIGMGDNIFLGDRNGVRTPMQWSPDRNAGFSHTNPQQLFLPITIDPEYHYESVNVENQERNVSSLLWWMRRVIAMRKKYKAFGRGTIEFLYPDNAKVLVFLREYEEQTILVVVNLSRFSQVVDVDLAKYAGRTPKEVFSQNKFPIVKDSPYLFTMGPHDTYWLLLEQEVAAVNVAEEGSGKEFAGRLTWKTMFSDARREALERDLLPTYLGKCRWFGGKGRPLRSMKISDTVPVEDGSYSARLLLIEVNYVEGNSETYVLPFQYATADQAHALRQEFPQAVIAQFGEGADETILFDAIFEPQFRATLLKTMTAKKPVKSAGGELAGDSTKLLKTRVSDGEAMASNVLRAEQSNTSVIYGGELFLKLYRRMEEGVNPDVELTRFLTEKANFQNVPPYSGAIEYRRSGNDPRVICMMQSLVQNQGDAWTLTLDVVGRFFERVLTEQPLLDGVKLPKTADIDAPLNFPPELIHMIGGMFPERARILGQRTAEMHLALASDTSHPDFSPEPFTTLYQRSVYQSTRNSLRRTFQAMNRQLKNLPENRRDEAAEILGREKEILDRVGRLIGEKILTNKIRIHGDYHLGLVLYTGRDFIIIDFEGEPARTLSERKLKRSPLRDVAGMLRSFHYAAYTALSQRIAVRGVDIPTVSPWADLWYEYVSRVFLQSYLQTVDGASFVPQERKEFEILLEAFLLDKAIYEVGYEVNNRPDWMMIPLRGIRQILDS